MKLRNKKTGEVIDLSIFGIQLNIRKENQPIYHSLAELNEEWEDYAPAEPLIKDKRIRKVIRAWAEVNSVEKVLYAERTDKSLFVLTDMGGDDTSIMFVGWVPTLKDGADYTIAELCGEEESPEPLEPSFIDLDERIKEKATAEKLYKGENDMHLAEEEKMRGFRAWHTKLGRYLKDNEFYVNSKGSVCSAFETYDDEARKADCVEDFSRDDFDEGYIIREDDTGLKDKNGKEIYEGDIVQWRYDRIPNKRVVEYSVGQEAYYPYDTTMGFCLPESEDGYEVIGNIHENPELLEGNE